ncbi:partial Flavin-dependent thymidylate synthase, partial [Anaerolineae bacterium]
LHNLFNFLRLRLAPDAQYEIRVYAHTIYREFVKPTVPIAAEAFEQYQLKPSGVEV